MVRVCVIGAGPSGLSTLHQIQLLKNEGKGKDIEVVCYEKQKQIGGLWNYNWRTGENKNQFFIL